MGALSALVLAAAVAPTPSAPADAVARWRPFVAEAAQQFALPQVWIERVMRVESGGRPMLGGRPITSPAGALGLMQLMPPTWDMLRRRLALGGDPHDPHDNIVAGAAYLRLMFDRFGYPGLFAAYNAGPARYAAFRDGRAELPAETRLYLARVTGEPLSAAQGPRTRGSSALFAPIMPGAAGTGGPSEPSALPVLFAIRH